MDDRNALGQYEKGVTGNRGGRPKLLAEWRKSEEAQRLRDLSYKSLEACILSDSADWRDKNTASGMLLDRIEGKPVQAVTGDDGGPLKISADVGLMEFLEKLDGG